MRKSKLRRLGPADVTLENYRLLRTGKSKKGCPERERIKRLGDDLEAVGRIHPGLVSVTCDLCSEEVSDVIAYEGGTSDEYGPIFLCKACCVRLAKFALGRPDQPGDGEIAKSAGSYPSGE
jgi:hypothetical protein